MNVTFKVVSRSDEFPTMKTGVWKKTPAVHGIFVDGIHVANLNSSDRGGLWLITKTNLRPLRTIPFFTLNQAKDFATQNINTILQEVVA